MRATFLTVARRWPGGLLLPLVLALAACETSPTEQLTRAETMFSRLESKGADQYLIYQMAEIRRGIEIAKKDLRNNRLEAAHRSLYSICARLDSCSTAFANLRKQAQAESQEQLQWLAQKLATLEQAVTQLPRQTYVDQNRYDIQVHRLRKYRQELAAMNDLIRNEDFHKALSKGDDLRQQVKFMLAGLMPVPTLASREKAAGKQQIQPAAPAEKPATAANMLAITAH